jgi:hypothetical protein
MEKGTIVYSGASHDLKAQPEIVHRYLGLSKSKDRPSQIQLPHALPS